MLHIFSGRPCLSLTIAQTLLANRKFQYRVTMAAIDPTEEAEADAEKNGVKPARSTLKIIRMGGLEDQFSSEDEDDDEDEDSEIILDDEDEESSDEEEVNGGPSDPEKVKKARDAAFMKESSSEDESDDEGPVDIGAALKRIAKGKAIATDDDDDDDDDSSEGEELEMEEFVVCTLDPEKVPKPRPKISKSCPLNDFKAISTTSRHCLQRT
jgi:FK506-binding nuclear protein